jgi:hypothetical protein
MTMTERMGLLILAWAWVTLPLLYGLYELILKVTALFK